MERKLILTLLLMFSIGSPCSAREAISTDSTAPIIKAALGFASSGQKRKAAKLWRQIPALKLTTYDKCFPADLEGDGEKELLCCYIVAPGDRWGMIRVFALSGANVTRIFESQAVSMWPGERVFAEDLDGDGREEAICEGPYGGMGGAARTGATHVIYYDPETRKLDSFIRHYRFSPDVEDLDGGKHKEIVLKESVRGPVAGYETTYIPHIYHWKNRDLVEVSWDFPEFYEAFRQKCQREMAERAQMLLLENFIGRAAEYDRYRRAVLSEIAILTEARPLLSAEARRTLYSVKDSLSFARGALPVPLTFLFFAGAALLHLRKRMRFRTSRKLDGS
ncbi:MAG: hypothetical protein HYU64_00030 [Armatimonadetes bacterium]|nr:hypothetical protein [Armatimonadota bacterium]